MPSDLEVEELRTRLNKIEDAYASVFEAQKLNEALRALERRIKRLEEAK